MKIVTWNVNGIRACLSKGFDLAYKNLDSDVFCVQETKLQINQVPNDIIDLCKNIYWHSAIKKGYSGTATFCKNEPISVSYGIGSKEHDDEGRTITVEYKDFYIVNAYVPNAQPGLKRLDFRTAWEEKLLSYLIKLDKKKPVIYCGDLNVAHNEIDLKNPKQNEGEAGFSFEERGMLTKLLTSGFSDVFRTLYADKVMYTWWSYRANARANNAGWRIDYFIVSNRLIKKIKDIIIHNEIYGSDHCPVELII